MAAVSGAMIQTGVMSIPPDPTPGDPDPVSMSSGEPSAGPVPVPPDASPAPVESHVPVTQPQAGWYPDPSGQQRWWDGSQWGIAASSSVPPTSGSAQDERSMATLAQVLAIFTGFLGPLVILLMARPDQPFVKHHAAEALNFQITVTIAAIVSGILILVLVGLILLPVVLIGALVLGPLPQPPPRAGSPGLTLLRRSALALSASFGNNCSPWQRC